MKTEFRITYYNSSTNSAHAFKIILEAPSLPPELNRVT